MSTLHILNKSSLHHPAGRDCMRSMDKQDSLLLIEDGVYLTLRSAIDYDKHNVYALQHDLFTRGISPAHSNIKVINDDDFVELCTKFDKTISWH